ncbi:MAG: hypothetical protein K2G28_03740 [Acetatifactor sp.]|nr:hypothetical protein [Acetatifactor sp.]
MLLIISVMKNEVKGCLGCNACRCGNRKFFHLCGCVNDRHDISALAAKF